MPEDEKLSAEGYDSGFMLINIKLGRVKAAQLHLASVPGDRYEVEDDARVEPDTGGYWITVKRWISDTDAISAANDALSTPCDKWSG